MSRRKTLPPSGGKAVIGDKRLIPRIKEYVIGSGTKVERINVAHLSDYLQETYSEYSRRRKQPFRHLVEKACSKLSSRPNDEKLLRLEESHLNRHWRKSLDNGSSILEGHSSNEISDSSDTEAEESLVVVPDTNMLNGSVVAIYKSGSETNTPAPLEAAPSGKETGLLEEPASVDSSHPKETTGFWVDKTPSANQSDLEEKKKRKRKGRKEELTRERKKRKEASSYLKKSTITFADVGGKDACLEEVSKLLLHMLHPEVYRHLGVTPPRGFLLHGPPGSGKTLLANAIAGELDLPFISIAATELVSGVSGESEEKIRELFSQAKDSAPCLLFLDEIDAITPKRENASKDMERRIVSQLLSCMDDLDEHGVASGVHVFVIGATNRLDSIDPALRRAGRFDREISLGIPNVKDRESILRVLCRFLNLSSDFDFERLAKQTPGYVGADLVALLREASTVAVDRVFSSLEADCMDEDKTEKKEQKKNLLANLKNTAPLSEDQLRKLFVTLDDFEMALSLVQPSAKREGFATTPDVTWADVGALGDVRKELSISILAPVRHPEQFAALGLTSSAGILLAGPPGCGKTLLAKAIANESGINFISVKGPELLNMYVGESERAVRQVFQRARNSAPCVIFFDEIDALCPLRSHGGETNVSARVVNQMLTEMDGLASRKQVFVMAATNRPDIIDPALLRPGRLDRTLYVGIPSAIDRLAILKTLTKDGTKPQLHSEVNLLEIAEDDRSCNLSGADLAALVREASLAALIDGDAMNCESSAVPLVGRSHFEKAFEKVKPSVTERDRHLYERMKKGRI